MVWDTQCLVDVGSKVWDNVDDLRPGNCGLPKTGKCTVWACLGWCASGRASMLENKWPCWCVVHKS